MSLRRWLPVGVMLTPLVASVGCAAPSCAAGSGVSGFIDVSLTAWAHAHPNYGYSRLCVGDRCRRSDQDTAFAAVGFKNIPATAYIVLRAYNDGGRVLLTRRARVTTLAKTTHDVCLGTLHDREAELTLGTDGHLTATTGSVTPH